MCLMWAWAGGSLWLLLASNRSCLVLHLHWAGLHGEMQESGRTWRAFHLELLLTAAEERSVSWAV